MAITSVSSPCFRFGSSALCVFPNCEGSGKALSTHGYASSFIPRRLAPTVSVLSYVSVSQKTTSEYGVVPGICSQFGQIGVSSQSEIVFSGSSFLSRQGADRPVFRQAHEATIINSENVVSSSCISPTNPFLVGSNGVNGLSFARWQSSQAFAPIEYQGPLVSSRPTMGLSHFPRSSVQQGRFSMAQQGLPVFRGTFMSAFSRLVSVHGCESGLLGSSYRRHISFWPMVCPLAVSAHKCPGTKSSHAGSEILSSGNSALSCIAVNRQYQSRTNGPINAHLTIAQVMSRYNHKNMKNKKHCCQSFIKISAVAKQ